VVSSTNHKFRSLCDYIIISKILTGVSACVNIAGTRNKMMIAL
jgi:hypothetical protein